MADPETETGWLVPDSVLSLHAPGFADACRELLARPAQSGHLDEKTRALLRVGLSAQVSFAQPRAVAEQVARALAVGATAGEVIETLELICQQGMSALGVGVPIVADELRAAGMAVDDGELDDRQAAVKAAFTTEGPRPRPWGQLFDVVIRLDPRLFDIIVRFIDAPWATGSLSPKVRELITVAMDAAPTNRYPDGLRRHVRKAINEGATAGELLEVLTLAASTALLTCELGEPALRDAMAADACGRGE